MKDKDSMSQLTKARVGGWGNHGQRTFTKIATLLSLQLSSPTFCAPAHSFNNKATFNIPYLSLLQSTHTAAASFLIPGTLKCKCMDGVAFYTSLLCHLTTTGLKSNMNYLCRCRALQPVVLNQMRTLHPGQFFLKRRCVYVSSHFLGCCITPC